MNGLVSPDRTPHPSLYEVKKVYQCILIKAVDLESGRVRILNKYDFTNLRFFEGFWELKEDDIILSKGLLPKLDITPGQSQELAVPFEKPDLEPGAEYWLDLSFRLAESATWAEKGHEVAWEQFKLPWSLGPEQVHLSSMPRVELTDGEDVSTAVGENFEIKFAKDRGTIASFKHRRAVFRLFEAPRERKQDRCPLGCNNR